MATESANSASGATPAQVRGEGKNPLDAIHAAALSDIGLRREENQDSLGTVENDKFRFFMVADGMGGVKGGGIASGLAIQVMKDAFKDAQAIDEKSIVASIKKANKRIFEEALTKPAITGMGTTFVGLAFVGTDVIVSSVGDSRAYKVREGQVTQLTEDHTLVMELLRSGTISPEQAHNHPVSHMLTRSLGPAPEVEVDCFLPPEKPRAGDVYLLCSDGLYNLVGEAEIGEILTTQELEAAVGTLVDLANERGGTDNTTVIAIELGDGYPLGAEADLIAERTSHETFIPEASREEALAMAKRASHPKSEAKSAARPPKEKEAAVESVPSASVEPIAAPAKEVAAPIADAVVPTVQKPQVQSVLKSPEPVVAPIEALAPPQVTPVEKAPLPPLQEEVEVVPPSRRRRAAPAREIKTAPPVPVPVRTTYGYGVVVATLCFGIVVGKLIFGGRQEVPSSPPVVAAVPEQVMQNKASLTTTVSTAPVVDVQVQETPAPQAPLLIDSRQDMHFVEPHTFPGDGSSAAGLTPEQVIRIRARQSNLFGKIQNLSSKMDSFDKPFSGDVGKILTDAEAKIEKYQKDLDEEKKKVDVATRRLAIWYQRRKELKETDPINLAAQVALSSEPVRQKHNAFKEVTANYISEAEVLLLNPSDQVQSRKVADLQAMRKLRILQLSAEIRNAIDKEISDADQYVAELALDRDRVELNLQNARRDVAYSKTLMSNDQSGKSRMREEFRRERDGAQAELDSLNQLLPMTTNPVSRGEEFQPDPNAAG